MAVLSGRLLSGECIDCAARGKTQMAHSLCVVKNNAAGPAPNHLFAVGQGPVSTGVPGASMATSISPKARAAGEAAPPLRISMKSALGRAGRP